MNHDIRQKGRTSQSATIAAASILELHFFTRSAQAQGATEEVSAFQDIASVDGVASVETLDDGRVELTLEDGSVLTVPAGEVKILNGTVFVSDSFLIAQGLTASSNNTVLLLTLGAVGVAIAANALESSSDSDDDVVPPGATPPPPPPPMPPVFTSSASASVAENQTDAYRAVATDADSDTLSYSLSGTDADRFMIDAATGEVRFIEAPDFEAPGDADADNVYDIIVTASDGANTAERTVAIMVTDENEAPIFTSDAAVSVGENQTAAYTALATDADGDTLSYNLSGTDAALFTIDAATGEVRFIEAPDFEAPGDADGDNVYDIVVTASDGTNSADQAVAITVTDENDSPIFTSDAAVSVAENQAVAYTALATDVDGNDLSYSLSGTDAALFMINAATGEVSFIEAPDFEAPGDADGDNVYDIVVTASDGTISTDQAVAITVTDENEPPIFTSDAAVSVAENQAVAYTALATDADGDDLSYNLSGTDAALFTIDGATGEVSFIEAPDFEAPGDADGDNVYDIVVTASDGTNSADQTVAITVTNENDNAPSFTSDAAVSVAENQTVAYTAVATDADGGDLSYNLSGTDAALFMIDATTGEVRFIEAPDSENPGDADGDNVYDIVVTASDGTISTDQTVAITVTNENDNAPSFTSDAAVSVAENQAVAYTALATDADGDPLSYSLSGSDAALFMIGGATGEVSFIEAPDFENPGDADGDNVYDIVVTASDGTNSTDQAVAITVTDENDGAAFQRLLDNPEEASVADFEAAGIERVNALTLDATRGLLQAVGEDDPATLASLTPQQVQAITDIARDHIVSISGPEDAGIYDSGEFTLGSNPAIVSVEAGSFIVALDYDGDGETDHIANIEFDADYRVQRVERDFGADNAPDDPPDVVEVVEHPDERTIRITYDIRGDGDTDRIETYTLDANGDRIRIDVDTDADGNTDRVESYEVDAGGNRIQIDFDDNADGEIDRTELDDDADGNPHRIETYTLDENGNRNRVRTDFDNDSDGSIDRAEFDDDADGATDRSEIYTYDASGNRVRTDFDDNNDGIINRIESYTLDANGNRVRTDLDDNNDGIIDRIETYTLDASGNRVRTNSDDNADGNIDRVEFDDDADGAADRSETYIYDASGNRVRTDFDDNNDGTIDRVEFHDNTPIDNTPIDNTPIDNTPIFTSAAAVRVAENQTVAYRAVATDADGDALSYSLSGTDAALFTIDPATGVVSFIAPPDFEAPGDNGRDNVYDITVTASDGANSTDQTVAITVTDVDDGTNAAPVFTSPAAADVAENQTAVYTAQATDADGDPLSYSQSGTDAALFTINPATGAVSFIAPPDFETPGDAGGDNVYDIVVTASDGINSAEQAVAITVTNVNDNTPSFTSPDSVDMEENQRLAYTTIAADADGDDLSYSLSGTDAALFTIDPTTGEVSFIAPPDAENPGDADRDNVYDIVVTASDGPNRTNQPVTITVTNVNDNTPSFTSPDSADVEENQRLAYTTIATDADGDDLSYSLSGTDAALFTIDPNTGAVSFIDAPDFEAPGDAGGDNVYDIVVTASDGTNSTDQTVAITVTNVNEVGNAPIFTSDASAAVAENQTAAYTAMATDGDGDALTYSLSGTDAALFTIDPTTGAVSFIALPDAENPGDADRDNVYDIVVTASDGPNRTNQPVTITVTNVNDNTPSFTSADSVNVAENQRVDSVVYRAVATDADGDPLSYSLSGTDAARFTIDPATGAVRFTASPDFENPGDNDGDNIYDIVVTASDGTNSAEQPVAITVTNVNDNTPSFTSATSAGVAENRTVDSVVYTAMATDADGDPLSYSLSGTDAALFTIDPATGAVRFIASPDFENPGDADRDNVYDIVVTASDGDNSANHDVTIRVTNVNDNTPSFTSAASASVAENRTADSVVYRAMAADGDGDPLSYSLSGTDAARFMIDPNTGAVRFIAPPDVENPGDADRDNVYDIVVTAFDGSNRTNQPVAITVTNVNDNTPSFTSADSVSVTENQPVDSVVYRATATDADGDPLSYSLSGTDAARFTINPATGAVRFTASPDFENPGDAGRDNVYDIVVTASDGDNSTNHDVAIRVTNVNDNTPSFTSAASASVAENRTADSVVYRAMAADGDGDALSYSLSGTDAARFMIDPNTGAVRFIAPPDVENPGDADRDNVYDIVVTAFDGSNRTNQPVAITVTDVNDNTPSFTSATSVSVAENQPVDSVVYRATATDADGDALSYSLSETDAARFTIDPATGAVRFIAPPDFENPGDADRDNVYDIVVTASDGDNSTNRDVAITVTDVNDNTPSFTSADSVSVAENQTVDSVVYRATATDGDGDDLTYSLSGTDAARFTINPATGEVRFIAPPDAENPDDAGGDNIYNITVTASDGDNSTDHDVAITVTNVNDNTPSFTSPDSASVAENQTSAYTAMATDGDGDALTYGLSGTDAALFTINGNTGVVSFRVAPDFEMPGDANGDNDYDIIVTASDGDNTTPHDVVITVTDEDEVGNAPAFTSPDSASVAENQTVAYTAMATDADAGDTVNYSLSGGADAARFTIDETTGVVRFREAPDFENSGDADGDNVYDIIVTATDGINETTQDVAITVTDVNDNTPSLTSPDSASVEENQTLAYTAEATDADAGDTLSYRLSGTDAALFTIDGTTGVVSFREAPDFEDAGDTGGDNVYNITVTATDGSNEMDRDVAITVTNVNDNSPSFTSPATASVAENQTDAYTAIAEDADGDALTYSLSGTDAGLFTINATTGEVRFTDAPDFEIPGDANGDNDYEIIVTASDGATTDATRAVTVTVTDVNEDGNAPVFTSPDSASVEENQTMAYTAMATDGDGDDLTYRLSGTDAARFTIDPNTGMVSFVAPPDFENPDDAGGDNIYNITVTASDDSNETDHDVAITVTNVNDNTPSFTSPDSASVAENQTSAYTAMATDGDGDALTYGLSGTDAALFTINGNTGVVSFRVAPDFEMPGDANGDNDYDIIVTASDGDNTTPHDVVITVTDEDEVGNAPAFTSPDSASVAENQTVAYTAMATDADAGDTVNYSLSGGADAARFTIDETTGVVRFREAPDFENSGDADGDNVYDIIVTATDGINETTQDVAITVTDVNDNTPSLTSPDSASVEENQTLAYTAEATDADAGDTLSYRLSGTDAALFTIDGTTGVVSFREAPDFEDAGDTGGDNVYNITVTATDGSNEMDRDVAITVTNVNDNSPSFTSPATASVAENQTDAYTAIAEDADGDALTYSLSGTDAGLFTINATTGEVRFTDAPDFEIPGDANGDNDYEIIVTASDGATTDATRAVTVTVTDVNEDGNAPVFTSPDSASVEENQTMAYTAMATDGDGDDLTYRLSGTDAARFTIDPNTGMVSFVAPPDFENPDDAGGDNIYNITVTASDDSNETDHDVAITVTNVNDNTPSFTSPDSASVAENQTSAYAAMATDGDGDALTYGLSGTDAALFTINVNTGVVSFRVAPDFEMPGDANGDNDYSIIVTASDGDNTTPHDVVITVTDEDEVGNAPAFTSPDSASVAENQTVAYTAMATDADAGDTVNYSLSGGADAARFTIDETTGVVSFMEAPDFEAPGDADGDNVYDIIVTATDGINETTQDVAITVTDVNDNTPSLTSPDSASVEENQTLAYTAEATDADAGDTLSYRLSGTDAALFTIDGTTGVVSFREAPDFEDAGDTGGDNVYNITVTATDGSNEMDRDVAITVTNVNDNSPSFTSPATASVAENQTDAYTAIAEDADGDALTYSLSGTDAGLFTIDATTGEVRFTDAPDFEIPGDANGDNDYEIIVTASDGATTDATRAVTITVTDEDEVGNAPAFTSPDSASVEENQTMAYTAMATDGDGDDLTYRLSGTDAARFTIDPNTGMVSFVAPPDFENPDDAGGDNIYNITVTASDDSNETDHDVTITVTNVNDNSPSFTSPDSASVAENQTSAYAAMATDGDGDALTYGLSGTDAALFTINGNTGVVSFRVAPDFEMPGDANGDNDYNIIVTASDGDNTTPHDVVIMVTDEDEVGNAPAFTSPDSASVAENQTVAYTAMATDADAGDTVNYSLSGGADAARFTIDETTGVVSFREAPDFENPGDADGDNVYDIIVTATDGINETTQDVAITVTDVNDNTPSFTSPASASVAENQTVAYTAEATDADAGDTLSYRLSGTDEALFTIDGTTGVVSFREAPDFEDAGDAGGDNVYNITVTATDGSNEVERDVAITVTNANDNSPSFTSPATVSVAENQTDAYTAIAEDADNDALTYSLSGTDAGLFTINATTGEVRFTDAPDFEMPGDANGDNDYEIIVTASDGATTDATRAVTVTVTDVNEDGNAPAFTSPDSASVEENQTTAYTAEATDADGDPLTYRLSGTDASLFTIDGTTGVVSFIEAPDFEDAGDTGGDNVYNITVTATDGINDTPQDVAITVTDVNDNTPSFTSPDSVSVAENQMLAYTAIAEDGDGDTLTYSLSGTDAARFTIDPATGAVSFIASPDFENPDAAGGNNVYDITVTASDDDNSTNHDVTITVTNENDNDPIFNSGNSAGVAENQNVDNVVYTAMATDADEDPLTYSLSGTDAARFTIDPATGAVRFIASPDFENPGDVGGNNVYDITVTASDDTGGTSDTNQAVAITVTNVNDNTPSFTSPDSASVAENQTAAYTAIAADGDGDDLTYSLSGTDAARFTIDENTGVVSFIAPPDFENPNDAGGDNVYNITVTASDDTNDANHDVAITVTNENDNNPIFISGNSVDVVENQPVDSVVYTAIASDADWHPTTPMMMKPVGTDASLFTISRLRAISAWINQPDVDAPGDVIRPWRRTGTAMI